MGFFDKVKAAANKLTGGGAKVTVSVEGSEVKGPIKVHVNAEIKDAPIDIKKVYLWVKSEERIDIPKNDLPREMRESANFGVKLSNEKFLKKEFVVADAQTLEGKQTYNWTYDLQLSGDLTPTYKGRNAHHDWMFYVGLDAKGNDPDSGWQSFPLH